MSIFTKKHSIGKTIADLRKQKGWTQLELAEKLQVSDKAVSKWEKDNGAPSIDFFPILAELFGVSIDYIMTGKSMEKEIVVISKAELCAKKDDVKLVKEIDVIHKDEKGKTFVDYIIQYESINVFVELCTISAKNICYFDILDALKMCLIANKLDLMVGQTFRSRQNRNGSYRISSVSDILKLLPTQAAEYPRFKQGQILFDCILNDDFYNFVVSDKRINSQTLSVIFGKQNKRECVWYHVFPYFINRCYINGNYKMLDNLLALANDSNEKGYQRMRAGANGECSLFFVQFNRNYYPMDGGHGFVRILEETIKLSLKNGDFKYFEKFNIINTELINNITKYLKIGESTIEYSFNAYIASEREIRVAKLIQDKGISKDELAVQSTIYDGIISIDEITTLKDYKVIKKALKDYPIHPIEKLCDWYSKKNWRKLFEYSVDNKIPFLPEYLIEANEKKIAEQIISIYRNKQKYWNVINQRHFDDRRNNHGISTISSVDDLTKYFEAIKETVLDSLQNKIDKDKITKELTKEYFEKELSKGNFEIVIIKLCVRLEAILRCRGYDGTFEEMLSKYCSQFNTYDDEDNNYDPHTPRMLQKLRIQRNCIVHSEKNSDTMSISEMTACINYICNMN